MPSWATRARYIEQLTRCVRDRPFNSRDEWDDLKCSALDWEGMYPKYTEIMRQGAREVSAVVDRK